jgi:hypothetical protein
VRPSLLRRCLRRLAFLVPVAATGAFVCALPSSALAAGSAGSCTTAGGGTVADFCFQPTGTAAGSAAGLDTSITFNYAAGGDSTATVKNMTVTLAPGLLAIPTAATATCSPTELSSGSCPAASEVGTGTVVADEPNLLPSLIQLPAVSALYAMPVSADASANAANDVAYFGLDIWLGTKQPKAGTAPTLSANASGSIGNVGGQPAVDFNFDGLPTNLPAKLGGLPIQVQNLTLDIDATVNSSSGTPTSTAYTRLPTSCAVATTTLSVDTVSTSGAVTTGTGSGADSFTPTGCGSLPFTPALTATAARDASDLGAQFVSTVTQPAGQAAAQSITLNVPPATLGPNLIAAAGEFGDVVGSAVAATPLLPFTLDGTVTLTGNITAPTLTITLPPPVPITLTGAIDILGNSVTFSNLPDVPLSSLAVTLAGGANGLYATTCAQPAGTLVGVFGGQNGASATVNAPFTVSNCANVEPVITSPTTTTTTTATATTTPVTTTPTSSSGKRTPPKISHGSLAGLASGNAKLGFTLTAGSSKLSSFTVSLPGGLRFDARTYTRGLTLSGGHAASLKLSGGRLIVTLRAAESKVTATLSAKAIDEVSALRTRVKQKKVRTLTTTVVAKSTAGASTTLKLTLKV